MFACSTICEKSEPVISWGRTFFPWATDRMVFRKSAVVAPLSTNPDTPARTHIRISDSVGARSMTITFVSGKSDFTAFTISRLLWFLKPRSRRSILGFRLRIIWRGLFSFAGSETTLISDCFFTMADMPSRRSGLSSMISSRIFSDNRFRLTVSFTFRQCEPWLERDNLDLLKVTEFGEVLQLTNNL